MALPLRLKLLKTFDWFQVSLTLTPHVVREDVVRVLHASAGAANAATNKTGEQVMAYYLCADLLYSHGICFIHQ